MTFARDFVRHGGRSGSSSGTKERPASEGGPYKVYAFALDFGARLPDDHSTMMRSAHSTSETKIAGLPNFAPQLFKSVSVSPRAREQAPQEKIGICFATTFSSVSLKGDQPTGKIAFAMDFRINEVASARRKICT